MQDELEKTGELFKTHTERYDAVDSHLGTVLTQSQNHLNNSLQRMAGFVEKIDSNFSSSIGALQEAIEELTDERKAGK